MMQEHVAFAEKLEECGRFPGDRQLLGNKGREFQIRAWRLVIKIEEARQIDRPIYLKHLPSREAKIRAQTLDDFEIGARLDLQAHSRALAAAMELRIDRIEDAARFFFAEV